MQTVKSKENMSKLDEILDAHSVTVYDAAYNSSYQRAVETMNVCRKEIESALKTEKSVKKLIQILKTNPEKFGEWTTNDVIEELESIVEES